MEELPLELFREITSYLSTLNRFVMRNVSKFYMNVVDKTKFDYLAACNEAAKEGSIQLLDWLMTNGDNWNKVPRRKKVPKEIRQFNHRAITPKEVVHLSAAYYGRTHILEWLREKGFVYTKVMIVEAAAYSGHIATVKWLRAHGYTMSPAVLHAAARGNQLPTLKWLVSIGNKVTCDVCLAAAKNGHLELLKWSIESIESDRRRLFAHTDKQICNAAASRGDIEMLKWLKTKGMTYSDEDVLLVVRYGHLGLLKWMKQDGAKVINVLYMNTAVIFGYFDIAVWLHEQGCGFSDSTLKQSMRRGSVEMIEWLVNNGCTVNSSLLHEAATYGSRDVVKWVLENSSEVDNDALESAVEVGNIEVIQLLMSHGYELYVELVRIAIRSKSLSTLMFLWKNGCPWDTSVFYLARALGCTTIYDWMVRTKCTGYDELELEMELKLELKLELVD